MDPLYAIIVNQIAAEFSLFRSSFHIIKLNFYVNLNVIAWLLKILPFKNGEPALQINSDPDTDWEGKIEIKKGDCLACVSLHFSAW